MLALRYQLNSDWLFYLFLLSYGYLIARMSFGLWFDGGINIFSSYSNATEPAAVLLDANKVYWSKTCFLFGTILLAGLNVDFRAAVGIAAAFWSGSLIVMFGASPVLVATMILAAMLISQQCWRRHFFTPAPTG